MIAQTRSMIQSGSCQQDKAAYRRAKQAAVFFSMGNFLNGMEN
jgi:hypothetical protein